MNGVTMIESAEDQKHVTEGRCAKVLPRPREAMLTSTHPDRYYGDSRIWMIARTKTIAVSTTAIADRIRSPGT